MRLSKQCFVLLMLISVSLVAQVATDLACLDCHLAGQWKPLDENPKFDHDRSTMFPLLGMHDDLRCTQCHEGKTAKEFHQFSIEGSACRDCHMDAHQNYWGDDCQTCHNPENWNAEQSYRRHEETLFPLIAAHRRLDCYLCHTEKGQLPSLDCENCHESDFRPELAAHAGLTSTADCSTCHGPTRWDQILAINHNVFFPIYSGKHRGEWSSCSSCHTQAGDYQTFTCFGSGCHSTSGMNSEHCEGNGCERCDGRTYPRSGVTPEDCYFCHPRGNESKCGD